MYGQHASSRMVGMHGMPAHFCLPCSCQNAHEFSAAEAHGEAKQILGRGLNDEALQPSWTLHEGEADFAAS